MATCVPINDIKDTAAFARQIAVSNGIFSNQLQSVRSQAVAKAMVEQGRGGRIVNFLSTAFEDAASMFSAYAVAKAGVWELTRVMAHELAAHRITVNAVTPGATLTEEKAHALATGDVSSALGVRMPEKMGGMLKRAAASGAMKSLMKQRTPMGRMGYPYDLACAAIYPAATWPPM